MLELVEMEMRETLTTYGFEGDETPIILGSALCALQSTQPTIGVEKIDALLAAVDEWIPTPERNVDKPFLMSVEDVFSIPGRGTVASGRVERGSLKKDSEVELVGKVGATPIKTKVTDIETFKKSCDESRAGDNSGLLLRGVKREDVRRGMVVAKPGTTKAHKSFLCSMYVLTKEEGGRHTGFGDNYRPQIYLRTAGKFSDPIHPFALSSDYSIFPPHTPSPKRKKILIPISPHTDEACTLNWPEGTEERTSKMAMPGDNIEMKCDLFHPLAVDQGQRFTIREGSRTVGTAIVTQILE